MATVASTITWALTSTALKAYLGISGSAEDARLQIWLEAAARAADDYMENPFTTDAGADETHPPGVKLGCYQYVKALRDYFERQAGVESIRTASLGETYRDLEAGAAALKAAVPHWRPYAVYLLNHSRVIP